MYTQAKLLEMLTSEQASRRYEACEWMRISQESSPEMVRELEVATHDLDKDVAERACLALDADVHHQMAIQVGLRAPDVTPVEEIIEPKPDTLQFGEEHAQLVEELKAYVGPKYAGYFPGWKPAILGEGKAGGFSLSGFFFSTLWLSYRKMYRYVFACYALITIFTLFEVLNMTGSGSFVRSIESISGIFLAIVIGIFGKRWYFNQAQRAIATVHSGSYSREETLRLLAKKGGTSIWAAIGLLPLFTVAMTLIVFTFQLGVKLVSPVFPSIFTAAAHVKLGEDYYASGDYASAITEYTLAIQLDQDSHEAYYHRGTAYTLQDEFENAIRDFTQAIAINPGFAPPYYFRGAIYAEQGDADRAVRDFSQAIQIDPSYADAYNDRAIIYLERNELDLAFNDLDQAIRISPDEPTPYFNRGLTNEQKGFLNRAVDDYKKVIELDPDFTGAYFRRANIYYLRLEYVQAIADLEQVIRLDPNSSIAYYFLGHAYNKTSDPEKAISSFKKVLELCGDDTNLCQDAQDMITQLGGE